MKKFILSLIILGGVITANAQPPKGDAKVGDFYGEKPSAAAIEKAVDADDLVKTMANQDSATLSIKGEVLDVCEKKGCWIRLKTDDNEELFVKMQDYGFFVPTSLKGKKVVLDGSAKLKNVSVSEQKHYAEDAKKSKEEIDAIKEPKTEIRYTATGIEVVGG